MNIRPFLLIASILVSANFCGSAAEPSDEFSELAQSLLSSIRNDDIVEYSSCWMSFRGRSALWDSDTSTADMRKYIQNRNKMIKRSFEVLQSVVREHRIDRQSITLASVTAPIRESNGIKRTDDFSVVFKTTAGEMNLAIDDGVLVDGLWYFTDSPTTLKIAGQEPIRFAEGGKR